jgi:SpoVK/Ycf46/Vps4 family AAA+-type ATPase
MLDESKLLSEIITSGMVWNNKEYSIIVQQHASTLSFTLKNIVWKSQQDNSDKLKDNTLNMLGYTHVGYMDSSKVRIKWIYDDDVHIIRKENVYIEKTYAEIIEWTDRNKIGGLNDVIWDIYRHLIVLRNPTTIGLLKRNGLKPSKGIILYGPPGNGKTKIARCIGRLLGSREEHIILKSATELFSKWLGESERNIAKLFEPAEKAYALFGSRAPLYTVIIDEIDIIAQQRGTILDTTGARDGMVNQLLTKIDGLVEKDNIILIGLTNREKILDQALLREGRLDRMVLIDKPNDQARRHILDLYVKPWINFESGTNSVTFETYAQKLDILKDNTINMSGADIQGFVSYVVRENWSNLLIGNKEKQPNTNRYIYRYVRRIQETKNDMLTK